MHTKKETVCKDNRGQEREVTQYISDQSSGKVEYIQYNTRWDDSDYSRNTH